MAVLEEMHGDGGKKKRHFDLTLEKTSQRRLAPEKVREQLAYIRDAASRNRQRRFSGHLSKRLPEPVSVSQAGQDFYVYTTKLRLTKEGETLTRDKLVMQYDEVVRVVQAAARTHGWRILTEGEEGIALRTGDANPLVAQAQLQKLVNVQQNLNVELPELTADNLTTFFGRLYRRENHIQIVHRANVTAAMTKFEKRRHSLAWGPPGCISGDAVIELNRCGKSFHLPLSALHRRFHGVMSEQDHGNARWNTAFPTTIRSMDEDGFIRLHEIANVVDTGIKETALVITESGKSVRATPDHLFFTEHGWMPAGDINEGMCTAVDGGVQVDTTMFEKVVKVGATKLEPVYDISLWDEPHNFLANGVVVHNCAKTEMFDAFCAFYGPDKVLHLDSTTTTKAGLETLILNKAREGTLPPFLYLEEIEKYDLSTLHVLHAIMDQRGRIQRTNARIGNVVAEAKIVVWATCNSLNKLKAFEGGAILSRFSNRKQLYCPRPDKELMRRILIREVEEMGGEEVWVDPVLDFVFDEMRTNDPREAVALLDGRELLLGDAPYLVWVRQNIEAERKDRQLERENEAATNAPEAPPVQ